MTVGEILAGYNEIRCRHLDIISRHREDFRAGLISSCQLQGLIDIRAKIMDSELMDHFHTLDWQHQIHIWQLTWVKQFYDALTPEQQSACVLMQ